MRTRRNFSFGSTSKHYTRVPGGKFQDVSEYGSVREAKRASRAEAIREKREAKAAKRQADALNRKFLAKLKAEEKARQKAESTEEKLARILQKKYEAAQRKAASVPASKRVTDRGILSDLLRENPDVAKWARMNPAKFDRCVKKVKAKGGAANAYAVCTAAGTRKKKRNPADASAEVFEEFHGFEPSEVITVERLVHHHEHLAAAGKFEGFVVRPIGGGKDRALHIPGEAYLAFNERKNQLFVEGGDQFLDEAALKQFGITEIHELETLGQIIAVAYHTRKDHLEAKDGGEAIYSHTFRTTNKAGRHVVVKMTRPPDLIYRVLDQQFEISGGSYDIRAEGIDK